MDEASFDKMLGDWNIATAELSWGVQRAFRNVFEGVRDYGTSLMYGADYSGGFPCLINTVGVMLTTGGGLGVPSANFGRVVSLFDRINRELESRSVNTVPNKVSPVAAEVFLTHFAPLKSEPKTAVLINPNVVNDNHEPLAREITDDELEQALDAMFLSEPPSELDQAQSQVDEHSWQQEHARSTSDPESFASKMGHPGGHCG